MTREEEINDASETYMNGLFEDGVEIPIEDFENIVDGFISGAKWADNHPKSHWISVKDKLPCNEKDLIVEILKGVELRTKKVGVLSEDGYVDITYMYSFPPHVGWHWNILDAITHWFPIPELPKE